MTLELNERQIRMALDAAPVPMLAHDETGAVRFSNQEWRRVAGPVHAPSLAESLRNLAEDPADLAGFKPEADRELAIRAADGSRRRWRLRSSPLGPDETGRAVTVVIAHDVTPDSAAQDALARADSRLRHVLRVGHAGHYERHFDRRWTEYSDELMAIHGLPESRRRESFEQWYARVHPADRGRVVAYAEGLADPGAPLAVEYRIVRLNDGAVRRISERREAPEGASGAAFGLQRDVTEPRAAEQALRDSEARLRMSLDAAKIGAFDWDLVANALAWDDRLNAIWGIPEGAPVHIDAFYRGLHPGDVARLESEIARSHDPAGDGGYDTEYRVVNMLDGSIRNIAARGRTLFENGRPVRMMGVVVEVTALREAQAVLERDRAELEALVEARTRELAETQTRLAHAQRMEALGQLAGGIAHDFNNVLQAVEASADLIERRPDAQNLPRYLSMAREATKRGSAISRRLLSFSHRAELEPERIDAQRLIADVAGVLRRTLGPGVTVEADGDDCPPLFADRRQLETALINLASNAREAMNGHGVLTLKARPEAAAAAATLRYHAQLRPGDYVRIELSDTGCGMAADVRARATEPFFSTKPRGQGAGLGLSMARGFADQSGGALRIDSEAGQGATVAIWLPVPPTIAEDLSRPTEEASGRLLLVDDDQLVRELIGEQLRFAGFEVTVCDKGSSAIARLDSGLAVDLLLTDFAMPEMNGVALAREARKRHPRLPVVVLTGYVAEAVDAAGEADFVLLRKPIDRKALIGRVRELMEAR